jgi:ASC-1-like (ASCH) protein
MTDMEEIGIESTLLQQIRDGRKTVECRLGRRRFLKFRAGDLLSLREDIYQDGEIIESIEGALVVRISQILYFSTFEEALQTLGYESSVPDADGPQQALATYYSYYSPADEEEYGVVAMTLQLVGNNG